MMRTGGVGQRLFDWGLYFSRVTGFITVFLIIAHPRSTKMNTKVTAVIDVANSQYIFALFD